MWSLKEGCNSMDTEQFKLAFKDIKAPDKVMHAGSLHYLDPVREKYVPAMPEEEVRQKVLQYLIKVLKVPKQVIRVEYLLSKSGLDSKNRADILIGYYNPDDGQMHCLCVIECKAPDIDILTEDVKAQAIGYSDDLDTDFVVVVNGVYSCCWIYDRDKDQYNVIKKPPVYQKMIDGDVQFEDYYECPERFKYEELEDNKYYYVNEYPVLAYTTNPDHLTFLTNLYDCLMLDNNKLPKKKYKYFTLLEDYGVRIIKVGNSSGGQFAGEYRSFRIKYKGEEFFANISIFAIASNKSDYNSLNLAMDKYGKNHNAVEYNFNQIGKMGDTFHFIHHGRLTCGKWGACKVNEFKEYLRTKAPFLLNNGKIDLGTLHNDRLICMNDTEMVNFIENLITYGLVRDEYRDLVEAKKRREEH